MHIGYRKNRLRDLSCIPSPKMYFFYGPDIENSTDGLQETTILILIRVLANGAFYLWSPLLPIISVKWSLQAMPTGMKHIPPGHRSTMFLQVRINSSSDFVHDGYDMGEYKYEFPAKLRLSQNHRKASVGVDCCRHENGLLFIDRFQFTDKIPVIVFTSAPTLEKEHTLTLRWTTVEGDVKTASITCTPEVDPALQ